MKKKIEIEILDRKAILIVFFLKDISIDFLRRGIIKSNNGLT